MKTITTSEDIEILARTIYGEARGEYGRSDGGIAALIAVGNVVMNRLKAKTWYGLTIKDICQKPFQFSCWNQQDPNQALITSPQVEQDPLFKTCYHVAHQVSTHQWPDLTQGSDHYYAVTLSTPPAWSHKERPRLKLGQHVFFKLTPELSTERN
jgi:N-acetylmuramoyl-L-alanine amidase